jgi:hypothetical protein
LPAVNGQQHGHNLRAILNQLCADADFDFRNCLCAALNGWFWVAGELPQDAFKAIVQPTKEPPEIAVPEFHPQAAAESDAVFTDEHRKDIEVMQSAGFVAAIDGPRLRGHSKGFEALVKATRPLCAYSTTSPCRRPQVANLWAYPQEDGGWSLTRFNKTPNGEAPCWHLNERGFASTSIPPRPDEEMFVTTAWGLTEATEIESPGSPPAPPAKKDDRLVIPLMTCRELDASNYEEEYLIEGTLVKGQPGIVAGPQKAMKTSFIMDMLISLATGSLFLGRIPVARTCRSIFLSGESGIATLRRLAHRISKAKGVDFPSTDNLWISEFLPWFTDKKHLDGIERMIEERAPEVLAVDPVYLCLSGADAGNIFAQGEKLRGIGQICRRHGVCLLLAHHMRKQGKVKNASDYEPRELDDISWSGFSEFVRQWLLIGRREQYEPGSGLHKLWLTLGGSAGHSNLWAVDVDEGLLDNRPTAWIVSLASAGEARAEKKADTIRQRLLDAARNFPAGETKSAIIDTAKLRRDHAILLVFDSLVEDRLLLPCEIKKGGRSYEAFRLAEVKA